LQVIEQVVETLVVALQDAAVPFQPDAGVGKGLSLDAAKVSTTDDAAADEASALEDADVLGGRGERHAQRGGQLGQVSLPVGEPAEHRPPGGMSQGVKHAVESRRSILNHMV